MSISSSNIGKLIAKNRKMIRDIAAKSDSGSLSNDKHDKEIIEQLRIKWTPESEDEASLSCLQKDFFEYLEEIESSGEIFDCNPSIEQKYWNKDLNRNKDRFSLGFEIDLDGGTTFQTKNNCESLSVNWNNTKSQNETKEMKDEENVSYKISFHNNIDSCHPNGSQLRDPKDLHSSLTESVYQQLDQGCVHLNHIRSDDTEYWNEFLEEDDDFTFRLPEFEWIESVEEERWDKSWIAEVKNWNAEIAKSKNEGVSSDNTKPVFYKKYDQNPNFHKNVRFEEIKELVENNLNILSSGCNEEQNENWNIKVVEGENENLNLEEKFSCFNEPLIYPDLNVNNTNFEYSNITFRSWSELIEKEENESKIKQFMKEHLNHKENTGSEDENNKNKISKDLENPKEMYLKKVPHGNLTTNILHNELDIDEKICIQSLSERSYEEKLSEPRSMNNSGLDWNDMIEQDESLSSIPNYNVEEMDIVDMTNSNDIGFIHINK